VVRGTHPTNPAILIKIILITLNPKPFVQPDSGYTILELLVVIFLISLLAGLVVPRLTSMYDSIQQAYEREEVLARLGGLSYLAFQQSRDFELVSYPVETSDKNQTNTSAFTEKNPSSPAPLELPAGWQVRTEQPIHFFANGVCEGGMVYVLRQQQQFRVQLVPPFCLPKILSR
jgi:general secretion pathway protein G